MTSCKVDITFDIHIGLYLHDYHLVGIYVRGFYKRSFVDIKRFNQVSVKAKTSNSLSSVVNKSSFCTRL